MNNTGTMRLHAYRSRKTWGQTGTDSQARIDFAKLRLERLHKLQEFMKRHGLEALLLFDGDNIRYATGLYDYGWRTYLRYCIVPLNQDPIMQTP